MQEITCFYSKRIQQIRHNYWGAVEFRLRLDKMVKYELGSMTLCSDGDY